MSTKENSQRIIAKTAPGFALILKSRSNRRMNPDRRGCRQGQRFASGNWTDYEAQTQFILEQSNELSGLVLPPELGSQVPIFRRASSDPRQATGEGTNDHQ